MMMKTLQFFKYKAYEFRWALLSGILIGTSYIPFPPWAVLFCLAPLWIDVVKNTDNLRSTFAKGWVTQFVLTLIGFHWIAYTAHEFGQLPWSVSIAALVLFCAFMHLYIPAAITIGKWLQKKLELSPTSTLFVIAIVYSLLERVWPVIFDWNLGYTLLWQKLPIYHFADVLGFLGLSALILLSNAFVGKIWIDHKDTGKRALRLSGILFAFLVLNFAGYFHGKYWNRSDSTVKVGIVQANIGNLEKIYAEQGRGYQDTIIAKFLSLTDDLMAQHPDTQVLIWPESAYPDYLDEHYSTSPNYQHLISGLSKHQIPLITGAYSKDPRTDEDKDRNSYNALFLVSPEGRNLDKPYRKTELLAFGEYLPLSDTFPILLKWLPFVSNFGRGQGPEVLQWDITPDAALLWGGQICYEGLYPGFSRQLSKKKANILVNVTNDSWFGKTFEPHQHLYMTLARTIETRRPLVRSTNTGISTVILANGDVLQQSPLHEEWVGQYTIPYLERAPQTLYVLFGNFDWILWILALIAILVRGVRNAKSRDA